MAKDSGPDTIRWHRGFRSSMRLLLWDYREDLEIKEEHALHNDTLFIDMVIQKNRDIAIHNDLGKLFRKLNILEYKSIADALNLQVLLRVVSYGYDLWSMSEKDIEKTGKDFAAFIFRHAYPRKLFQDLKEVGTPVKRECQGVYSVKGIAFFPVYIVVCKELDVGTYAALRVLIPGAKETDFREMLSKSVGMDDPAYRQNLDAVLQIVSAASPELFQQLRRDQEMFDMMKDIMKDEFDKVARDAAAKATAAAEATAAKAVADAEAATAKAAAAEKESVARKMLLWQEPAEKIMDITELPLAKLMEIAGMLHIPLAAPGNP